jgi:hypothetical protein
MILPQVAMIWKSKELACSMTCMQRNGSTWERAHACLAPRARERTIERRESVTLLSNAAAVRSRAHYSMRSKTHGMVFLVPLLIVPLLIVALPALGQGLKGEPEAVTRAEEMIERIGGKELWSQLRSLSLKQRFYVIEWRNSIIHQEWIDFETPRLWVSMKNEQLNHLRVYDASGGWWLREGEFSRFSEEHLAMERGFWKRDMFRCFHLIASEDPGIELRMNGDDRLEVYESSGDPLCWFRLSPSSEPVLWGAAVEDYEIEFIFGPMKQFGNIRVPSWGGDTDGSWRFNMLEARGSVDPPPVSYDPPPEFDSR